MTAAPCPSADVLRSDPSCCPVCGRWDGHPRDPGCCLRRWYPRTVLELRALVYQWQRIRYTAHGESFDTPLNREAFDAWLRGVTPCVPVPAVVPCRLHELVHVAKKQAQNMTGAPAWR